MIGLKCSPCLFSVSQEIPFSSPFACLMYDVWCENLKKILLSIFVCLGHKGKSVLIIPLCLEVKSENIFGFEIWINVFPLVFTFALFPLNFYSSFKKLLAITTIISQRVWEDANEGLLRSQACGLMVKGPGIGVLEVSEDASMNR